jgi:sporulation protein YlmC with PRC-barrel domain
MLHNVRDLRGYAIRATDGLIGKVDDFYFDDEDWAVRYLVVDTGRWLSSRKVLIPPIFLGPVDRKARTLSVSVTMDLVNRSPGIDTQRPVSRQYEANYSGYFGGAGLWGMGAYPGNLTAQGRIREDLRAHRTRETRRFENYHLRSSTAVIGHHIAATDGYIGHLDDLRLDDHSWAIRYLVVNTSNSWGGRHVLITPQRVEDVSWPDATVSITLTRQAVEEAPPYEPAVQLDREQKEKEELHSTSTTGGRSIGLALRNRSTSRRLP